METFISKEITKEIYNNMLGKSIPIKYKDNVNIKELSYLKVLHYGFDSKVHIGRIIVNRKVEKEVLEIFKNLYEIKYPIEKIKLIDEYDANDELSMENNNTSCFCFRTIAETNILSKHSQGLAIDINPLYNPYITKEKISPSNGKKYANRTIYNKYQINKNDIIYNLFKNYEWNWGGDWEDRKDYQHFEKNLV